MGSGTNNKGKKDYTAISNDIRQLYADSKTFQQKSKSIIMAYQDLGVFLSDSNFGHQYFNLESELNNTIAKWNPTNSIEQLKISLKSYLDKLSAIDKMISKIEGHKQDLLRLPNRHDRKNATDKIDLFLKNVSTISVSQLDRVKDDVIPKVLQMIKDVQNGFEKENKFVADNKIVANSLLKRLEAYKAYVDKFGLFKTRAYVENVAKEVLNSPNLQNPNTDRIKLQDAELKLNSCTKSFEQEIIAFKQWDDKLKSDNIYLWLDDYRKIRDVLDLGAPYSNLSVGELESMYAYAVTQKKTDLLNFLNGYNKDIIAFFQKEINYITNNCVDKEELGRLRKKIEAKIKDDKKELYKKIAKIVAIVSAIIAFIVLMVVYWPWSGIVVGIIVASIIFMIVKN